MPPVPDDCASQLQVCAVRVCALELDGTPLPGAGSMYVTNAMATATLTPVYNAGSEIKENNACGETLIDFLDDATLVRGDLTMDFLLPDPYLMKVLVSQGALLTPVGGGVGFAYPPIGKVTGQISIELFAKRVIKGVQSAVHPWAHWALPYVKGVQLGARTFDSTNAQHTLISAQCYESAKFFDGPANDWVGPSDRFAQQIPVDAIPTPACGPLAVIAS